MDCGPSYDNKSNPFKKQNYLKMKPGIKMNQLLITIHEILSLIEHFEKRPQGV